jgi:hypothetical protein
VFDNILNEYLKHVNNESVLNVICLLFNFILDSGIQKTLTNADADADAGATTIALIFFE